MRKETDKRIVEKVEQEEIFPRYVFRFAYSTNLLEEITDRLLFQDFPNNLREAVLDFLDNKEKKITKFPPVGPLKETAITFSESQYFDMREFMDENELNSREFVDLALLHYLNQNTN